MSRRPLSLLLWSLGLCVACDDPLTRVDLVNETRVLGVRVVVEGATGGATASAWPAPGDDIVLRVLVAEADPEHRFGWAIELCAAAPGTLGVPRCDGMAFDRVSSTEPEATEPEAAFTLPDADDLGAAEALLAHGLVCSGAQPELEAEFADWRCPDGARAEPWVLELGIARDGAHNDNPSIADARFELDGAPWSAPPSALGEAECSPAATAELPRLAADGEEHELRLRLARDDRERLPERDGPGPERETLQVANFVTAGELARSFTFIEADADFDDGEIELAWTAPEELPEATLVRFFFVVRDGRGGSDWTLRALCLER